MKVRIIKLIHQAVLNDTPEYEILKKIRDIIQGIPSFNIREKARLYRLIKKITVLMYIQNGNLENRQIKMYSTGWNKIEEHKNSRERRQKLVRQVRGNRANDDVFYMCSIHSNPAEDHKKWQGVIFVDRFWKSVLEDDKEMQKKVAAYIRNHDTMTVQEIIKDPVYLITRPYCKHFFIALSNDEVLSGSVNKIQKEHPEAHVRTHNINYRQKFYRFRNQIYTVLNEGK